MATTLSMFCAHKRLRTACAACRPALQPPSALVDDEDLTLAPRRQ